MSLNSIKSLKPLRRITNYQIQLQQERHSHIHTTIHTIQSILVELNHLNCFSTSLDQSRCPHIMRISLLLENIYSSLMVVWLLLDLLQVQQIYIGLPNHHSYHSYFGCKLCTSTWRVVSHSWSPFWLDFTEELPAMNVSNLINIIMKTCNSKLDPYLKQQRDKLNMVNCTKNIEMLRLN